MIVRILRQAAFAALAALAFGTTAEAQITASGHFDLSVDPVVVGGIRDVSEARYPGDQRFSGEDKVIITFPYEVKLKMWFRSRRAGVTRDYQMTGKLHAGEPLVAAVERRQYIAARRSWKLDCVGFLAKTCGNPFEPIRFTTEVRDYSTKQIIKLPPVIVTDTKIVVVPIDKLVGRPVVVEVDKLVPVEKARLVMLHQPQTQQIAALGAPTIVSPVLSGLPGIAFGSRFEQRISGGGASIAGSANSMNNNEAYGAAAAAAAAAASTASTSTSPGAAAGSGNGSSGSGASGASGR